MRGIYAIAAAAIVVFGTIAGFAADPNGRPNTDQRSPPAAPPLSGTSSSDLGRSGGVITPPADVDPQIKRMPSHSGDPMPIIPPPGTPGGDPSIKPK
jgi:hypothetical protein